LDESNEKVSPEALYEIIEAFSNELIEEDYILYSQMLDRWLKDRQNRSNSVAKPVATMAGLCAIRSMEDFVPSLMVRGGREGLFMSFDEEEHPFIDRCPIHCNDSEFFSEYGHGYRQKDILEWQADCSHAAKQRNKAIAPYGPASRAIP
jgi:hypothetical protein